jgi:hypothetical protein
LEPPGIPGRFTPVRWAARVIAVLAAFLALSVSSAANAEIVEWTERDEAACSELESEYLSWGRSAELVEQDLRENPSCRLSDTTLRSHFPEIGRDSRLDECPHHTFPRSSTIRYAPSRTGPNTVSTREVHCAHFPYHARSDCEFRAERRYFLENANDYFEVGSNLPEDTAIQVARSLSRSLDALFGATGLYRERVDGMALSRLTRHGTDIEIRFENCGCRATVLAALPGPESEARLVPSSEPALVCF